MTENKHKKLLVVYDSIITVIAIISIVMAIMDICGKVSPDNTTFYTIDNIILIIFAIDYICRFIVAPEKKLFLKSNVFDLIAIIPFSSIFSFFRFARLFRLAKFTRLLKFTKFARIIGMFNKLQRQLDKFLHTNGFIYMLYTAGVLIIVSSLLISYIEGKSFTDALWWSIVTCTTVGYGDISPSTGIGRVIAVILMIFGVGLISMLTGTITTFFSNRVQHQDETSCKELDEIIASMDDEERSKLLEIAQIIKK